VEDLTFCHAAVMATFYLLQHVPDRLSVSMLLLLVIENKNVPAYALCTQKCTFSSVMKHVFNIFDPKTLDKMF
jgi:hypothetical protein